MIDREKFFAALRKRESGLFGTSLSKGQIEGLNAILDEADGFGVETIAYILATAYHETGRTMQPVRETFAMTDEQAAARLEKAWKAGKLKWVKTPYWRPDEDGKYWIGKGYVQITHKRNYERLGPMVGVDLVAEPDLAMQPDVAAKILVVGMLRGAFTGKALSDYVPGDYVGARRIVNGNDRARKIAEYAKAFETALRAAYTAEPLVLDRQPTKEPSAPQRPITEPVRGIEAIIKAIVEAIVRLVAAILKGTKK